MLNYMHVDGEVYGKLKIMVVLGTRPGHKMAPLVLELQKQKKIIQTITVVTAQHRQMLDQVLKKPLKLYQITILILWGKAKPY